MNDEKPTFQEISRELSRQTYGVLSTITKDGRPHSTGVLYVASLETEPLHLYVLSDKKSRKTRNIISNPNVSFTVPAPRRFFWFVPPSSIQFQGKATLVPLEESIRRAFSRSMASRQVFNAVRSHLEEDGGACIIRITPDPQIFTYGLGMSVIKLARNMEKADGKVAVPASRRG